jgi:hypothetical protein
VFKVGGKVVEAVLDNVVHFLRCNFKVKMCQAVTIPGHFLQFLIGEVHRHDAPLAHLQRHLFVLIHSRTGYSREDMGADVKGLF